LHCTIDNPSALTRKRSCTARRICAFLAVVLLALVSQRPLYAQPASEEYKIKAAFIFHFSQLVDWPGGASDSDLDFCIFNDEPRREELKNTLQGKLIGARVIDVRVLMQSQELQGCNIVFLSRSESWRQAATINSLRGLPILTVGETDNFISDGGMIRFHVDGDKIRFDINLGGADSSHLKISSRLLLLATSVTGGGADRGR
jgi:hypothetical protein